MDKTAKVESGAAGHSSAAKAIKVKTEAVGEIMIYAQSSFEYLFSCYL